jgi:hypothetical protein
MPGRFEQTASLGKNASTQAQRTWEWITDSAAHHDDTFRSREAKEARLFCGTVLHERSSFLEIYYLMLKVQGQRR